MDGLIPTIFVVFMFGFAIIYAIKMDHHFDYYKLIFPEKFKDATSFTDSMQKFIFIDLDLLLSIMLPIFINRYKEIEEQNIKVKDLSKKIIRECYLTWMIGISFFMFILIIYNKN
jgi:hypothetical protein